MDMVTEAEFLTAAGAGRTVECGDSGGTRRQVDAALLRRCCHQMKDQIDPRGIRLRDAAVAGPLDLAGLDVPFPLRFDGCEFSSPLVVEGARLYELVLTGCARLPGLLANGVRVRRDLDLRLRTHAGPGRSGTSASTSSCPVGQSAIWLCESEIGGRLLCVDTVIDGGGERSIQADRLHVTGNVRLLHQFTARGEVRLIGARIGGSLDLTGASIESPATGLALDLGEVVIEASVFMIDDPAGRRPHIRGRIDMGQARVGGQFLVRNATLEAQQATPAGQCVFKVPNWRHGARAHHGSLWAREITLDGTCQVTQRNRPVNERAEQRLHRAGQLAACPGPHGAGPDQCRTPGHAHCGRQGPRDWHGTAFSGARIHGNLRLRQTILSAPEGADRSSPRRGSPSTVKRSCKTWRRPAGTWGSGRPPSAASSMQQARGCTTRAGTR